MRTKSLTPAEKSASRSAALARPALLLIATALAGCSSLTPAQSSNAHGLASYYAHIDEPLTDD